MMRQFFGALGAVGPMRTINDFDSQTLYALVYGGDFGIRIG